jgi:hypothetical protein
MHDNKVWWCIFILQKKELEGLGTCVPVWVPALTWRACKKNALDLAEKDVILQLSMLTMCDVSMLTVLYRNPQSWRAEWQHNKKREW